MHTRILSAPFCPHYPQPVLRVISFCPDLRSDFETVVVRTRSVPGKPAQEEEAAFISVKGAYRLMVFPNTERSALTLDSGPPVLSLTKA